MAPVRKSTKSLRSSEHRALCALLIKAREKADLTQVEVASRLGKPQSFVSKYESGERRLDVVEFIAVARALRADPASLFKAMARNSK
jgi:transcriptional regulator with XRE-family HTH domain